jgi:hypothetical protein
MKNVNIVVMLKIFIPKIGIKIKIDGFSDIAKDRRSIFWIFVKSKNNTKNNIEIIKNSILPLSNE